MRYLRSLVITLLLGVVPVEAQITPTYTFSAGTVIRSSEVNANFALFSDALNRTGGTMTGSLTVNNVLPEADNTRDLGSAALSFNDIWIDGTATIATMALTTLTCTGCVGATQLADTAVSASSYGSSTSIPTFTVDADGRLTAAGSATPQLTFTSTYFSSLDGSAITAIAEANITDGTILARVASNETITGSWTFLAGATGAYGVVIRNSTAGENWGQIKIQGSNATNGGYLRYFSDTYTTLNGSRADGLTIQADGAGGLNFVSAAADPAQGVFRWYAQSSTLALTLNATGLVIPGTVSILESTGATYYGILDVGDLVAADATYTFSGTSGTVYTSANDPLDSIAEWQSLCTNCVDADVDLTGTTLKSTVVTTSITSTGTVTSGTWSASFGDASLTAIDGGTWTGATSITTLGTITTGTWNAGSVTSSGGISGTTGGFSSTLTLSGAAANIALGSNYLSGDGGDEGIAVGSTGEVAIGQAVDATNTLTVLRSGVTTSGGVGLAVSNTQTNATTDGIEKFGLSGSVSGVFTGSGGASTVAYGVYGTAAGADVNWAGYFAGDVTITGTANALGTVTSGTWSASFGDAEVSAVAGGTYTGDDSITTVGTIATGTWNAGAVTSSGKIANSGEVVFSDGDLTPSVSGGNAFYCAYTTGGVSITDFDDGTDGQIIVVRFLAPAGGAITVTRANAYLAGGADLVVAAGTNATLMLVYDATSGLWVEISRSNPVS